MLIYLYTICQWRLKLKYPNAIWERYRQTSITNGFQEGSFQVFKSIFCVLFAYAYVWEVGVWGEGGWCKRISDMWRLLAPLTWELWRSTISDAMPVDFCIHGTVEVASVSIPLFGEEIKRWRWGEVYNVNLEWPLPWVKCSNTQHKTGTGTVGCSSHCEEPLLLPRPPSPSSAHLVIL